MAANHHPVFFSVCIAADTDMMNLYQAKGVLSFLYTSSNFFCIAAKALPNDIIYLYSLFLKQRKQNFVQNLCIITVRINVWHIRNFFIYFLCCIPVPVLCSSIICMLFSNKTYVRTMGVFIYNVLRFVITLVWVSTVAYFNIIFVINPRVDKTDNVVYSNILVCIKKPFKFIFYNFAGYAKPDNSSFIVFNKKSFCGSRTGISQV